MEAFSCSLQLPWGDRSQALKKSKPTHRHGSRGKSKRQVHWLGSALRIKSLNRPERGAKHGQKAEIHLKKFSVLTECLTSFLATGRLCYEPYALQSLYQYYPYINTDTLVLRFANYISREKKKKKEKGSFLPLTYHSSGIKYTWPMHNQEPKSVSVTYMTPCRTFWGSRSNNLST